MGHSIGQTSFQSNNPRKLTSNIAFNNFILPDDSHGGVAKSPFYKSNENYNYKLHENLLTTEAGLPGMKTSNLEVDPPRGVEKKEGISIS